MRNDWRTAGSILALLGGLVLGLGGCEPADDFLYELRFGCGDGDPCAAGFECGPEGVCVKEGSLPEVCNGQDDDKDGETDEEPTRVACALTEGVCAGLEKPVALCLGAAGWDDCRTEDYTAHDAAYEEVETTCDGLDNDCDGVTDNVDAGPTEKQSGVCEGAVLVCDQEALELVPGYEDDPLYQEVETACDGVDNDCDGATDPMLATSMDHCGTCDFACAQEAIDKCTDGVCQDLDVALCGFILGPDDHGPAAEMCELPAGDYPIGEAGDPVTLGTDLLIDRFEVTNGRYAQFLEAQDDADPYLPSCRTGDRSWTTIRPSFLQDLNAHPVVCVTRDQAAAFCAWAGKRLPSAEEWEAAARGQSATDYPWGDESGEGRANCLDERCHDVYPQDTCEAVEGSRERCADTAPVLAEDGNPTLPDGASSLGPLHMAGNAAEWVEPAEDGASGSARGGSYDDDTAALRVWVESDRSAEVGWITVGFRCVAAWPEL